MDCLINFFGSWDDEDDGKRTKKMIAQSFWCRKKRRFNSDENTSRYLRNRNYNVKSFKHGVIWICGLVIMMSHVVEKRLLLWLFSFTSAHSEATAILNYWMASRRNTYNFIRTKLNVVFFQITAHICMIMEFSSAKEKKEEKIFVEKLSFESNI